jgi:hypothetical protein
MSLRIGYLALIAAALLSQAGCCCTDCWPCGKTWCGPQCGQVFWHEWFSHPPECCDPCDKCGNYTGATRQSGYPSPFNSPYEAGYQQGGPPMDAVDSGSTESTTGEYSPELADPLPAEELPPGEPSASAFMDEFGQAVSYQAPVDSPRNSRKLGTSRRASGYDR